MSSKKEKSNENKIIDIDYLPTPLGALMLKVGSSGKTLVTTESEVMLIIDSDKKREFKTELKRLLKKYDTGDFMF